MSSETSHFTPDMKDLQKAFRLSEGEDGFNQDLLDASASDPEMARYMRESCTTEHAERRMLESSRTYHVEMLGKHLQRGEKIYRSLPILGKPLLWYESMMIEYHNDVLRHIDELTGGY